MEKDLLARVAEGDAEAFSLVFMRYWDAVYSAALLLSKSPETAEDISQEVFTRVWAKRKELGEVRKLDDYLFIIARNMIYGRLRREAVEEKYRLHLRNYFEQGRVGQEAVPAELRDLGSALQKAIAALPDRQQQAFRLSRFGGLSHDEIAGQMGISKITVKNYIVSAIAALRKALAEHTGTFLLAIWIDLFL